MNNSLLKVTITLLLVIVANSAYSERTNRFENNFISENVTALETAGQVICAWNPFSLCVRSDQWGTEVWPHYMAIEITNEEDE